MDICSMDMRKTYMEYDQRAPRQKMQVSGGEFDYRYYKNPAPEIDATIVVLAGGTGLAEGFFLLTSEIGKRCSYLCFSYPQMFRDNDGLADGIAELLQKLQIQNAYFLGQSYGGLLSQVIAARHPEVVNGLILSSTASFSTEIGYEGMACITGMISPEKEAKNKRIDKLLPKKLLVPMMKMAFGRYLEDKEQVKKIGEMMDLLKGELSTEGFVLMDTLLGDLRNQFGRYKKEDFDFLAGHVLIIEPEDDTIFTEDIRQALFQYFRDAKVVTSVQGGHLAILTDCDSYLEVVFEFLRGQSVA